MSVSSRSSEIRLCLACLLSPASAFLLPACRSTMPSARLQQEVALPVPAAAERQADPNRLTHTDQGETYTLTPRRLIRLAFDRQPDV